MNSCRPTLRVGGSVGRRLGWLQVGRDFKRVLVPGLRVIAGVGFSEMPHRPYQVSLRPGPHGLGKAQAAAATDLPLQGPRGWSAPSIRPFLVMWMRLRKTSAVSLAPARLCHHPLSPPRVHGHSRKGWEGCWRHCFSGRSGPSCREMSSPTRGGLGGKQLTSLGHLSKLGEAAEGLKGLVGLEALLELLQL